jgi:hypothetical protein
VFFTINNFNLQGSLCIINFKFGKVLKRNLFKKIRFFVWDPEKNPDPGQKIDFLILFLFFSFQNNSKFKIYYAKWTLQMEVVNG